MQNDSFDMQDLLRRSVCSPKIKLNLGDMSEMQHVTRLLIKQVVSLRCLKTSSHPLSAHIS